MSETLIIHGEAMSGDEYRDWQSQAVRDGEAQRGQPKEKFHGGTVTIRDGKMEHRSSIISKSPGYNLGEHRAAVVEGNEYFGRVLETAVSPAGLLVSGADVTEDCRVRFQGHEMTVRSAVTAGLLVRNNDGSFSNREGFA